MKKGKPQRVPWFKYRTDKFEMPESISGAECGAYALYAITKKSYNTIAKLSRKGHWPNSVMFSFLKKHGYTIIPVTIGNVVEGYSIKGDYHKYTINSKNVLLIDQKCYREENSWTVLHNNLEAHSGYVDQLSPLEFVNNPIEAAYIVFHDKWR